MNLPYSVAPLVVLVTAAALGSCASRIELRSADGSIRLSYACSNIQPTAETVEELRVVASYAVRVGRHAMANQRAASAQELNRAAESGSLVELERVTVEYLCRYHVSPSDLPS